jgi:hypothetical protein
VPSPCGEQCLPPVSQEAPQRPDGLSPRRLDGVLKRTYEYRADDVTDLAAAPHPLKKNVPEAAR